MEMYPRGRRDRTRNAAGRFPRRVGSTPTISVRKPEAVNKTGTLQNYSFCNVPVCVLSLNWLTRPFSICACPESSSLAAALSSAVAELFCTILEICSTPCVTWAMEAACSPDALDIFQQRQLPVWRSPPLLSAYGLFHPPVWSLNVRPVSSLLSALPYS